MRQLWSRTRLDFSSFLSGDLGGLIYFDGNLGPSLVHDILWS